MITLELDNLLFTLARSHNLKTSGIADDGIILKGNNTELRLNSFYQTLNELNIKFRILKTKTIIIVKIEQ